ncbi:MAG: hypothetical protein LM522_09415 [Candidatus Contendobacter sp.]|nr:hypothetical protein [Candidatus Contendobacter sp.]
MPNLRAEFSEVHGIIYKLIHNELLEHISGVPILLSVVEQTRLKVSVRTEAKKKSLLGQFLTPENTASFMADLFPASNGICRLLDAGAGIGSLSSAFLEKCITGSLNFNQIQLKAFELDDTIHNELHHSLSHYIKNVAFLLKFLAMILLKKP